MVSVVFAGILGSIGLQDMSVEEKVGQVLMVHFHGQEANEEARALIQDTKVGGIIYYNWSNGLTSPKQVQALSLGLQRLASPNRRALPLLIAVDQEGGRVARLQEGFPQFPSNGAVGATGDPDCAEKEAFSIGSQLQAVGVNMNLAPVVDISNKNSFIGDRSFGDHPDIVAAFGERALLGYKKAHIIATLKHFPGCGNVIVDPHVDLPTVHKSMEELKSEELVPFAKLASKADAIMVAHLWVPAFDTENCSTLSKKTISYLKETIGYTGVVVSDSLVMDGVLKKCHTVDEAAIQALNAGCDLLILGGKLMNGEHAGFELTVRDVQRVHQAVVSAVKSGRVPETRLNQAVEKIIALKRLRL